MNRVFTLLFALFLIYKPVYSQISVAKVEKEDFPKFAFNSPDSSINFTFENKEVLLSELVKKGEDPNAEAIDFALIKDFDLDFSKIPSNCIGGDCFKIIDVSSKGALTLSFYFKNLTLTEGSELFLLSNEHGFIQGGILFNDFDFTEGVISSLMPGETVRIILKSNHSEIDNNKIVVSKIAHGILDFFEILEGGLENGRVENSLAFGTVPACIRNIICEPNFTLESKAVAMVLTYGYSTVSLKGTAALINNGNQDRRAIMLTAGHVFNNVDFPDNVQFWFHYRSPQCSPTATSSTTVTVQKADALSVTLPRTDSKLIELRSNPKDLRAFMLNPVSWLGWSIIEETSSSLKLIGHPDGDLQKYIATTSPVIYDQPVTGSIHNYWWLFDFIDGYPIQGSSGSPVLNDFKRVIGPLAAKLAGTPIYGCGLENKNGVAGRLSWSWSEFAQFLDPNDAGIVATNTITSSGSSLVYPDPSAGQSYLCSNNTSFALINAPVTQDIPVSWSISTGATLVTPTSGSGKIATLSKATPFSSGVATIKFEVGFPGFTKYYYKNITVGTPSTSAGISGGTYVYTNSIVTYSIPSIPGATSYNWQVPAGWTGGGNGLGNSITVTVGANSGTVSVTPVNNCGNGTTKNLYVTVDNCPTCREINVSPNPSSDFIQLSFPNKEGFNHESIKLDKIEIYDLNGRLMKKENFNKEVTPMKISVSDVPIGVYLMYFYFDGGGVFSKKILVDR